MTNRQRDIICAVLFLGFGIFMFSNSLSIHPIIPNEVGSGYVPKVLSLAITFLSALLFVLSLLKKKVARQEKSDEDSKAGVFTILALAVYVVLFQVLGFLVATVLYLFFQITLLSTEKNRNLLLFGAISIVVPVVIYMIFKTLFQMSFPVGILGI